MLKTFVVVLRYADLPTGTNAQKWEYKSRDVALARVTALFVEHPHADLFEDTVEQNYENYEDGRMTSCTTFTMTVDRG